MSRGFYREPDFSNCPAMREADGDDSSEWGLPEGYVDPLQYRAKTPEDAPIITVSIDSRI